METQVDYKCVTPGPKIVGFSVDGTDHVPRAEAEGTSISCSRTRFAQSATAHLVSKIRAPRIKVLLPIVGR